MKLGEICQKIGSGATPTGGKNSYADSGISLIRSQNVLDFAFSYNGLAHINEEQADKLRNVNVLPEDVLLNITGDSVARVCMVDEAALPARVNQHVAIVRVDKALANPYYVMLWLVWQKNRLLSLASNGATRHALTKEMIQELDLSLPSLNAQTRVSRLLHSLDRKIALNRRKIATLEKMAKEIYDYWFVQYDFPDANGRPYKSSGGEMVYSPELKREIPKGWKACSINDCGRFCRGVAYTRADERLEGENTVLVMRGNNISEGHIIDDSNRVYVERELVSDEQYLNKFEVLFAMSSGSKEHVGKAAIGYDYPRGAAFGAFCSKFVPEGKYRYVVYSFLASAAYRSFIKQVCAGTGINNLKSEHFDVPLLAFPLANELLDRFNAVCAPLYESIFVATQDAERMESLRGFSLPLLMNGQVKVGE